MATSALRHDTFEKTIDENGIVLVDFWATWCAPCRAFSPIYEQASEKHPDIHFGKVDTEAEPELAGAFGIRAIPTLLAFKEGVLVFERAGMLPPAALEQLVKGLRDLDMTEVRAKIAEQTGKAAAGAKG